MVIYEYSTNNKNINNEIWNIVIIIFECIFNMFV